MNTISGATLHPSTGLFIMPMATHKATLSVEHVLELPVCCPVSGNPKTGSKLSLYYPPDKWVIEVYSLKALVSRFVGGFESTEYYPSERNMEGMCQLIAQMCADAIDTGVEFRADLVLDAGGMVLTGSATPQ